MRRRSLTTLVSLVHVARLWFLVALAMAHTTCSIDAATAPSLVLRVDVQNLPRRAVEAGRSGQMSLRVAPHIALHDLRSVLQERLVDALDATPSKSLPLDFDVEVYDPKADRFRPLTSLAQLGRRSRLNVVLHKNKEDEDDESQLPALPARMFAVNTRAGGFRINGYSVFIDEVENSGLGTGLTTWDGSVVLAKYLEHKYADFQDKCILEVGAGTGLVSLSAALIGGAKQVILTDLDYTMANLQRNIQRTMAQIPTSTTRVHAQVLDWFKPRLDGLGDVDIILASDVVWIEELIAPLVNTMHQIASASTVATKILMSHQQRSVVSDSILFQQLSKHGFTLREVGTEELHPDFVSDKISVWEITLG